MLKPICILTFFLLTLSCSSKNKKENFVFSKNFSEIEFNKKYLNIDSLNKYDALLSENEKLIFLTYLVHSINNEIMASINYNLPISIETPSEKIKTLKMLYLQSLEIVMQNHTHTSAQKILSQLSEIMVEQWNSHKEISNYFISLHLDIIFQKNKNLITELNKKPQRLNKIKIIPFNYYLNQTAENLAQFKVNFKIAYENFYSPIKTQQQTTYVETNSVQN